MFTFETSYKKHTYGELKKLFIFVVFRIRRKRIRSITC